LKDDRPSPDKIGVAQKEAIMQVTTSWEEKGVEAGIGRGIEQGQRSLVSLQLEQKIGKLPEATRNRIFSLSLDQLSALARCFADTARVALLNFNAIDDLNHWLETNG
jgi:Domain of unknown function (DUF4351)